MLHCSVFALFNSFACGEMWHDPVQCKWLKEWIRKCDDDSETSNWLAANTKVGSLSLVIGSLAFKRIIICFRLGDKFQIEVAPRIDNWHKLWKLAHSWDCKQNSNASFLNSLKTAANCAAWHFIGTADVLPLSTIKCDVFCSEIKLGLTDSSGICWNWMWRCISVLFDFIQVCIGSLIIKYWATDGSKLVRNSGVLSNFPCLFYLLWLHELVIALPGVSKVCGDYRKGWWLQSHGVQELQVRLLLDMSDCMGATWLVMVGCGLWIMYSGPTELAHT